MFPVNLTYLEVQKVESILTKLKNTAAHFWSKVEAAAAKRDINLRLFVVLYTLGVSIFYFGLWILVTRDFFFGLLVMAGSYLFDYGYIFVFGNPDKKLIAWLAALASVALWSLSQKVGLIYAICVLMALAVIISTARFVRLRGKK